MSQNSKKRRSKTLDPQASLARGSSPPPPDLSPGEGATVANEATLLPSTLLSPEMLPSASFRSAETLQPGALLAGGMPPPIGSVAGDAATLTASIPPENGASAP